MLGLPAALAGAMDVVAIGGECVAAAARAALRLAVVPLERSLVDAAFVHGLGRTVPAIAVQLVDAGNRASTSGVTGDGCAKTLEVATDRAALVRKALAPARQFAGIEGFATGAEGLQVMQGPLRVARLAPGVSSTGARCCGEGSQCERRQGSERGVTAPAVGANELDEGVRVRAGSVGPRDDSSARRRHVDSK